ncbi:MAG: type II toxin-antitoxin system RelE/ParE family toxin [Proteobacteria bacterium]|nr:type II toxin-antitoxin system RelE/ParE family toxin [Pseudomonadota bacterium]
MKSLKFVGTSLNDLKKFPDQVRQIVGYQLHKVQTGQNPSDWKPMNTIGQGVKEIRVHLNNEYRVLYVATLPESVYVLHAFQKKTQKTRKQDLDIAANRYKEIAKQAR